MAEAKQVTITVSGPVASGKSKLLAEICATLGALKVPYRFADDSTRHGVTSDMHEGHVDFLALYNPSVVLIEVCEPLQRRHQGGGSTSAGG